MSLIQSEKLHEKSLIILFIAFLLLLFIVSPVILSVTEGTEISHVGIYLYKGKFIHSPGKSKFVRIDSLCNNYW